MKKDTLLSNIIENLGDWAFDDNVADVFPDMLTRSIPGYDAVMMIIGLLTARFATKNSNLYDLGCSLGSATLAMQRALPIEMCQIIAVDNSQAMIARFNAAIANSELTTPITIQCADICDIPIENASIVILNFTLQFLPPEKKQGILDKIYQGLNPGGIVLLSEKLSFKANKMHDLLTELHVDFKKANQYSELEIHQKRRMLENVMRTDTLEVHQRRLGKAGFKDITTGFQCFNFASLIAIK